MTLVQGKTYTPPNSSHTESPSTPGIATPAYATPTTTRVNSIASDKRSTEMGGDGDQVLIGGPYNPHGHPRTFDQLYNDPGYLRMLGPTNRTHLGLSAPPEILEQEQQEALMMHQALQETRHAPNAGNPINSNDLEAANRYFERFSQLSDDEQKALQRYDRSGQRDAMPNTTELLKADPEVRAVLNKLGIESAYA